VDRELSAKEWAEFLVWLKSTSLSTHEPSDEMLIAFRLGQRLGRPATDTIRASRGQRGQGDLVPLVEAAVDRDETIEHWMDGRVRRLRFVEA